MLDVKVVDAYPGWGKTTNIINMIKKDKTDQRYLVITPYLSEAHRYAGTEYIKTKNKKTNDVIVLPMLTKERKFIYSSDGGISCFPDREFKHPMNLGNGKSDNLKYLIENNHDIVSTHALFTLLTQDVYALLEYRNYILIIDECVSVAYHYQDKTPKQISKMFTTGLLYKEPDGTVRWDKTDQDLLSKDILFPEIKRLADNGNLISLNDSNKIMIWRFPIEFLMCFSGVNILTYRFKNSLMDLYFKKYDVVVDTEVHEPDLKSLRGKVRLLDNDKMNFTSKRSASLSKNSFNIDIRSNNCELCDILRKNMTNFVKNICKCGADRVMWTCFKDHKSKLKGQGYSKAGCWLPMNTKATNDFVEKDVVMYPINRFMDPHVVKFLNITDEEEDFWALSEMIQLIWRSKIRVGADIDLYIASPRMRELFIEWLKGGS